MIQLVLYQNAEYECGTQSVFQAQSEQIELGIVDNNFVEF